MKIEHKNPRTGNGNGNGKGNGNGNEKKGELKKSRAEFFKRDVKK